jgi:TRAP-type C4-dicarboxylate transport system permease small subunit
MDIDQSLELHDDTLFDRVILNIATFLFMMIILLATVQVVVRVFNLPIAGGAWWTTAVARYTLIFGTFFGAAVASRNGEHIKMDILRDFVAGRAPRVALAIDVIAHTITISFLGVAVYAAGLAAVENWGDRLLDLPIQSSYVYAGITLGLAAVLIYEVNNLLVALKIPSRTRDITTEVAEKWQ